MSGAGAAVDSGAVWKLVVTAFFVALNGFFVAAEFALVKVRVSRLDTLAQAGSRAARATMAILTDLNLYLSSCQLGITISSLVLGWLAEPAVATLLLSAASSAGLEVQNSPGLHVAALAEGLDRHHHPPHDLRRAGAEDLRPPPTRADGFVRRLPADLVHAVLKPFIWLINAISNQLLRLVGVSGHGRPRGRPRRR